MRKILTLLSIVVLALCFASCSSNSPEGVVKKYYNYMQDKKYEEAIDLLHFDKKITDEQRTQLAAVASEKITKTVDEKGGMKSFEVEPAELSEDGESGTVKTTVTYGNGKTETENVSVVKVDGKWMIASGK